ncbi:MULTISPECIES: hypothetical protein [Arthrobacter]|uniref:HK97 gp10 family phage protein n=1 Tax=Arthrobacter terricola TaxID=2547396 RepID=A0A4R5K8B4_9MICC|nr:MULTISPECIES: hypothetical protein [Arthrobacter]MBT8159324.1 hypothetical protein [Arthrobacter sp. GN70]TDF86878.1 hypothetical protein E1809_25505 [Arthrobacter terricola]
MSIEWDFDLDLGKVTEEVLAAVPEASFKAMEHLREVAVSRAPLETGNLRAEAHTDADSDGATVKFDGPYARYQEFGVSKYGKPLRHEEGQSFYLTSSVFTEKDKVIEILGEELRQVIE